jgi:mannose-6-phosphate isomerase-like protein (cupin superfamily)
MKIFRLKDMKEVQKPGFILKYQAEINLKDNVSSVGFFRPDVPPNGKLRNHYHHKITEFLLFLNEAKIKAGSEIYDVFPGDLVMFPPGEWHEVLAGSDGTMPIVIKMPNDPEDTQTR